VSDLNRKFLILRAIVVIHETVLSIPSTVPEVDRKRENGQNECSSNEGILQQGFHIAS